MDLLTVLVHEVSHLLGLDHADDGVMSETLAAGTREGVTGAATGALDALFSEAAPAAWSATPFRGEVLGLLARRKD